MLIQKVENYIKEYNLLEQNDRVVVGVSGGADSVCLLLILFDLSKKMGFKLCAHHVNHMIRGLEADADEVFVKRLCEKIGVECSTSRINVPLYAREHKLSEEEAGRIIRYEELRKKADGGLVGVAHNKDDQVETILHNIIRGTSLTGLTGMKARQGDIIRPLLCASRSEIEEFLNERGQDFRIDSTNLSEDYTRNKIRLGIIPKIKEINPNFADRLLELSKATSKVDEEVTREAIKEKAIYLAISEVAGSKKDITSKHVESVLGLEKSTVGAKVNLPYDVVAKKGYDGIKILKETESLKKAEVRPYNGEEIPNDKFTKWIDYDKIETGLLWRYREKGDKISLEKSRHKKLKDYFIDEKIPKEERDKIPVLADGKNIVLIYGGRLSEDYKITKDTKKIIVIKLGEDDG